MPKSRTVLAVLSVIGLFVGTVFIIFSVRNSIQITPDEADVYTGELEKIHFSYGRHSWETVNFIVLTNGGKYDIRPGTVSDDELKNTPA